MDYRHKSKLVDCPRCQGGKMQPFLGEWEGAIGCRLCKREQRVPDYLAGAYRLLAEECAPHGPSPFHTEELRCLVVGRTPTKK
jgi:hypothetical protein